MRYPKNQETQKTTVCGIKGVIENNRRLKVSTRNIWWKKKQKIKDIHGNIIQKTINYITCNNSVLTYYVGTVHANTAKNNITESPKILTGGSVEPSSIKVQAITYTFKDMEIKTLTVTKAE